ncbi:MAG: tetratricopeptide repeat protein [Cyclobacteriaceae bacterium]|nr:tetratricopeptide repeat protein [Cyclobacteriaceae bacterium]
MKYFLFCLLLFTGIFFQCTNSTIRFNALYPAELDIPVDIQSVAIIDRSAPENKLLSIIEGGITGEGIGQDKLASGITLNGVSSILQNSERYSAIRTNEVLNGTESGRAFPDPLSWDVVDEIARKYEVDMVLSLESFDSDFMITDGTKIIEKNNADGIPIRLPVFYARGVASVNIGFRMYDPVKKNILDQYHFSHNMDWETQGNSIADAASHLIGKDKAVKDVAYEAGRRYGQRITPSWYRVTRIYYKKAGKNPDLEEGARWMEANNWDGAIKSLDLALENGDRKSRGMAAHNLAVVYEILGDLENSRNWAQKAWAQYENKDSKDYAYKLNLRIQDRDRLRYQMGQ